MAGLVIPEQPALDSKWLAALRAKIKNADRMYTLLGPDDLVMGDLKRTFFESGYQTEPDLRPDGTALSDLQAEAQELSLLLYDLEATESDERITQAYRDRIREMLANMRLYEASLTSPELFRQANEVLYDAPDPTLAKRLQHDLRIDGPDTAVFDRLRDLHMGAGGYYSELLGIDPSDLPETVSRQTGDPFLQYLLVALQAESFALRNSPTMYWGIDAVDHQVLRPVEYDMPRVEFMAIVGHEIGSHLLEFINGCRQGLSLLGIGLSGYERGNEGRALLREQVVYPTWQEFASTKRWLEIRLRYYAIALGSGVVTGTPEPFSAIFAAVRSAYLDHYRQHQPAEADDLADQEAWHLTARCLKGTDGHGGAYYKDMVYLSGNLACWQLAQKQPEKIMAGDAGKFDVANPEHWQLLNLTAR